MITTVYFIALAFISLTYLYPILGLFLDKNYKFGVEETSLFFTGSSFGFFLCYRIIICFREKSSYEILILLGLILGILAQFALCSNQLLFR